MYRICALALFGLSFLLLLTDASIVFAVPAAAAMPGANLMTNLPSALAIILAALARYFMQGEENVFAKYEADYYAPLGRMVRILDRKDAAERLGVAR